MVYGWRAGKDRYGDTAPFRKESMRAGARPIAIWALPLAVLVLAAAVLALDLAGSATRLSGLQFDTYQRLRPRDDNAGAPNALSVRVLDIDSASSAKFGPWPWPADTLTTLTAALKKAGASVIVYAFSLDQSDPASPQRFAAQLPPGADYDSARSTLEKMTSADEALAQSFQGVKAITGFTAQNDFGDELPPLKSAIAVKGVADPFFYVPHFRYAGRALPLFEAASAGAGARNLPADRDGVLRALPLLLRVGGKIVPSLDGETMRVAGGEALTVIGAEDGVPAPGGAAHIASLNSGALNVTTRRDGALVIYFGRENAARHISAAALLGADLKNAIVFIGPPGNTVRTAGGLRSIADVHAEALENILRGQALTQSAGFLPQLVFLAVIGAALIFLFARIGSLWAGGLTLVAIIGAETFGWVLFSGAHTLLDCTSPSAALALACLGGFAARASSIANARAGLRRSFADALPPAAIDKISRNPSLLKLDGETRLVSCVSCGIRRYAELAESFKDDPADFTRMISAVLAPLIDAALDHGGTIGHLGGDSFIAYWNAPLDDSEHAIHACDAAQAMTLALASVNEQLSHERRLDGTAFGAIEIGIGISTGPAICGGFTARGRTSYSVTGDCTILADTTRIISAQYGPAIVVSDDTRKAAERGYAFLEVDFIAAGPRGEPVKLFAVLGNPLVRASPKFRALATFHDHIFEAIHARQWEKARGLIDQCRKLSGASQKLYDLHLQRIDQFEDSPPPADWDGAYRSVVK
jgi:adenylate cyclase